MNPLDGRTPDDDEENETSALDEQPPLLQLTRLLEVPVTEAWPTEPHHFTPWLLGNGDTLAKALGLDIELKDREHRVGKFSLAIIGREGRRWQTGHRREPVRDDGPCASRPVACLRRWHRADHDHLDR